MIRTYDSMIQAASDQYNVPFDWVKAIMLTESSGNPAAWKNEPQINDASRGLMQLLYRTAQGLGYTGTPAGLYDPQTSINLGTMLLAENIKRFGADFQACYSAYNSGSPTSYKTNAQVGNNVATAMKNLAAVDDDIAAQQPVPDDSGAGTDGTDTSGGDEPDTSTVVSLGVMGAILAAAFYYFVRKG